MSPLALVLLLGLVPLVKAWNSRPLALSAQRKRASLILRCLSIVCLVLILAGAQVVTATRELSVVFLMDRSLSTGGDSQQWQLDYLRDALPKRGQDDSFGVVLFGAGAHEELSVGAHDSAQVRPFSSVVDREASNLTSAMRFAATVFPGGTAKRLVLLSDGQSTEAEASDEAAALAATGVEVWTVPSPQTVKRRELLLSRLEAPNSIALNEPFVLRAVVESQGIKEAELLLTANGEPQERLRLRLRDGPNLFLIPQRRRQAGPVRYEARILSELDDRPENNKGEALVMVGQQQVVMVLRSAPGPGTLVPWLEKAGLKAQAITPDQLPRKVGAWRDISALVIEDVSALEWSLELQKVVSLLVRDGGMGLMMLGSDSTFGVGGYGYTPIEPLLPVELAIRRPKDMPLAALVQCLDKSGSMSGRPIEMAREAAIAAGETLSEKDLIGVVSFDEAARWVYPLSTKDDGASFTKKVASLRAGGGTDLYPALSQAIDELQKATAALKHVIILSDGATAPADFDKLLLQANQHKISISAVALGSGADIDFLTNLTKKGKGRLYVAPDTGASTPLPQIFIREALLATGSGLSQKPTEIRPTSEGLDSSLLQGVNFDKTPALTTYNLSSPKGGTASTLLASPKGDPVLATGRAGLGKTAAWTSDLGGKWAAPWLSVAGAGKVSLLETLILRSIRSVNAVGTLSERSRGNELRVRTLQGGELSQVELQLISRTPLTGPVKAVVVNGRGEQTVTTLYPQTPYQASGSVRVTHAGSSLVFAQDSEGSLLARSTLSVPLAPEFARLGNDTELLKSLATQSKGEFSPLPETVFRPPANPTSRRTPLSEDLARGAMMLLMLEVAVRRLPRPKFGKGKSVSESVDEPAATSTVAALRQTKQAVREEFSTHSLPKKPRVERGSAASSPKLTSPMKSTPTPPSQTEGSTLERLRQAKKRGQDRT